MYCHHKKILNNKNKAKYCKYCNYTYTISSWSAHYKTKKHKINVQNFSKSKQKNILDFF